MKITLNELKKIIRKSINEADYIADEEGEVEKHPSAKWVEQGQEENLEDLLRNKYGLERSNIPPGAGYSFPRDQKAYDQDRIYRNPTKELDSETVDQFAELQGSLTDTQRPTQRWQQTFDHNERKNKLYDMIHPSLRNLYYDKEYDYATEIFKHIAESDFDTISQGGGRIGTDYDSIRGWINPYTDEERNQLDNFQNKLLNNDELYHKYGDAHDGGDVEEELFDLGLAVLEKEDLITGDSDGYDLTKKGMTLLANLGWKEDSKWHDNPNAKTRNPKRASPYNSSKHGWEEKRMLGDKDGISKQTLFPNLFNRQQKRT